MNCNWKKFVHNFIRYNIDHKRKVCIGVACVNMFSIQHGATEIQSDRLFSALTRNVDEQTGYTKNTNSL